MQLRASWHITEFEGEIACESDLIRLVKERGREACTCGGRHYMGTTKEKMGSLNKPLKAPAPGRADRLPCFS